MFDEMRECLLESASVSEKRLLESNFRLRLNLFCCLAHHVDQEFSFMRVSKLRQNAKEYFPEPQQPWKACQAPKSLQTKERIRRNLSRKDFSIKVCAWDIFSDYSANQGKQNSRFLLARQSKQSREILFSRLRGRRTIELETRRSQALDAEHNSFVPSPLITEREKRARKHFHTKNTCEGVYSSLICRHIIIKTRV